MKTFEDLRRITPIYTPKFGTSQNSKIDIDIDRISEELDELFSSQASKNSNISYTSKKAEVYMKKISKYRNQSCQQQQLEDTRSSFQSLKISSPLEKKNNIAARPKHEKFDIKIQNVPEPLEIKNFNLVCTKRQSNIHPNKKNRKQSINPVLVQDKKLKQQNKFLASIDTKNQLITKLIFMIATVQNTSITEKCCKQTEQTLEKLKQRLLENY